MSTPKILAFGGSLRAASYNHKLAAILACSPGGLGGSRGLAQLRTLLENIRVTVLPGQVSIPKVHEIMGEDGELADAGLREQVLDLGAALARKLAEPGP